MRRKLWRRRLFPHLLQALLGTRETIPYPHGPLELPAYYAGAVVVDISRCIGCGRCARDCPADALVVARDQDGSVSVTLFYARCANCGQCELSCPTQAIERTAHFVPAESNVDSLALTWKRQGPATR